MAAEVKLDKLELNPVQRQTGARNDALERIMQKAMETQGTNLLMHEMIEPDRKAMKKPQKAAQAIRETVLMPKQMDELARLAYTADKLTEQTVVNSVGRGAKLKLAEQKIVEQRVEKAQQKTEEQPIVGYHAKKERDTGGRYKKVA